MTRPGTRYALLLRGVNVGKNNSLPMAELRGLLTGLGRIGVATSIQSGNAVFGSALAPSALTTAVERALAEAMGRPIATTLRTRAQPSAVVAGCPWPELAAHPAKLCATFLGSQPTDVELAPLATRSWEPERFAVGDRLLYT